jgi:hypothetical protein
MSNKSGINIKKSKEGSLHKALGVPKGEKIPASKLKIKSTDSPALKKKKQFAINAKHFKHQTGGKPNVFVPGDTFATNATQDMHMSLNQDDNLNNSTTNPNDTMDFENSPQGKKLVQKYQAMGYKVSVDPATNKIKFSKNQGGLQENPGTKIFNEAASVVTGIGNAIQNGQQNHNDHLQLLDSMTPKFFQNMEAQGLDNVPAYTMYGGNGMHGEGTSPNIYSHSIGPNFRQYSRGIDSDTSSGRTTEDVPVADPKRFRGSIRMYGGYDRQKPYLEFGGITDPGYMIYGGQDQGLPTNYAEMTNVDFGYEGIRSQGPYGQNSVYRTGGNVTSTKAKEILRDGTVHGQALTDKQRRYFGWIAGGSKTQTGGNALQQASGYQNPEEYYKANATLAYYKDKLNDQLKSKNPQAFGDYFKGLVNFRKQGNTQGAQDYTQNSEYNEYLSPDEVKKTLGSDKDYDNYINSLKQVNSYNISQGKTPLYGNIEGENDVTKLNYGRRFASLQVNPSLGKTLQSSSGDKHYNRNYNYNPQTGQVDFTETGDTSLRPEGFAVPGQPQVQQQTTPPPTTTASKKYGGRKYKAGGLVYKKGQELDLTPSQIKKLKEQGYQIEEL